MSFTTQEQPKRMYIYHLLQTWHPASALLPPTLAPSCALPHALQVRQLPLMQPPLAFAPGRTCSRPTHMDMRTLAMSRRWVQAFAQLRRARWAAECPPSTGCTRSWQLTVMDAVTCPPHMCYKANCRGRDMTVSSQAMVKLSTARLFLLQSAGPICVNCGQTCQNSQPASGCPDVRSSQSDPRK
jgi:hypothetical protein